ncbi:MAG: glycine dehydrogenase (aminomethyl-transferring) [Flavobacteriales bacterium]|nr:glycine dehydrogenase (aminomethyl-transferring) [Flavobacteriales bacterium]|tara:strand:- start:3683 stop:6550 length:2868 start_codon:yes stop_codon:yes gene_type:complete
MNTDLFENRHIGLNKTEIESMLSTIGLNSIEDLINKTIPKEIRLKEKLQLDNPLSENEFLSKLKKISNLNKQFKSFIGMGYNPTCTPGVIQRNILENPGWYTSYTPYQAEISQGRLEALLNFQTMVTDLTRMEIANASLLDESTAAAEAMIMLFNQKSDDKINSNKFFVSNRCLPQTLSVIKTRSEPLGIEIIIGDYENIEFSNDFFGVLIQYPDVDGELNYQKKLSNKLIKHKIKVVIAADILSLSLIDPPGNWDVDVVVGSTQRFGIPLGYGGPHAAFFATKVDYKRSIPGRIIGISKDCNNKNAYRMALQTREQHIRRERATSNICTSQVLLAIMAGMYAIYHGPSGLKYLSNKLNKLANTLNVHLSKIGINQLNYQFFDTISVKTDKIQSIKKKALKSKINFRYQKDKIGISLNETTTLNDINAILDIFYSAYNRKFIKLKKINEDLIIDESYLRKDDFLKHKVFNSFHSETELMRYIKSLENKDLALNNSMIPLGSCTMKLNSATQLIPLNESNFSNIHPFAPENQTKGYKIIIDELERDLCKITGFSKISFQPNSGAQGEYTGLMVIRKYFKSKNETHRNIALIPASAHGTNPASAVMAGLNVVVIKCDSMGNIDLNDLNEKVLKYSKKIAVLMITYPSTHGVFEKSIKKITNLIHKHGGQVYMDGANMNAQVGLTSPFEIGADVCHLNLHKTFAIPHGGGGPGSGPIGVAKQLIDFLPNHPLVNCGGKNGISSVSSAPFGSSLILLISYAYIKLLGSEGLTNSTKVAILNANYMKSKLEQNYKILYTGENKTVAHEFIIECRDIKALANVDVEDICKRLMDFGFHAPTVSFPVPGTLMIEPTESENKKEIDDYCEALISIKQEINDIINGNTSLSDSPLKNAPHVIEEFISDNWKYNYSRETASFPHKKKYDTKFWPTVKRINQALGDRNLICTCQPIENYLESSWKI